MSADRLFERYRDLCRYVAWSDDDARRVQAAYATVAPHFARIVDDFYAELERHPDARAVIREGTAQVERLKVTLLNWLDQLFVGPYDESYVARRWKVGLRHVEIGLDQVYTSVAVARIRAGLTRIFQSEAGESSVADVLATVGSINRLLDLDLAIIQDAYQFEYMQRQKRSERLVTIGQMASGIAHELRNPLNVVKTSVYYLQNARSPTAEKQAEHFARVLRQVSVADTVIGALSDYAKLPLPEFQPIAAEELFATARASLELPPTTELVERCEPPLPPLLGDLRQLTIVLANLIRNAHDAMPQGGRVTLAASLHEGRVRIEVEDQGSGIDPDEVHRVFEPFYSKKARGMGLGLAIVRAIVENHRGEIHLLSDLGKGSRFILTFPAALDASAAGSP